MSSVFSYKMSSSQTLTSNDLKKTLRELLLNSRVGQRGAIGDQSHWCELARSIPIYSQRELCKFLLLAAQHDCVVDTDTPGLIKKGARNSHPCWTKANFENSQYWIEHIAPAAPVAGQWDQDIYEDVGFKDRLGNLVVMPYLDNILAGNQPWENKKRIYELLTESDLSRRRSQMENSGLSLSEHQKSLLMNSEYQPALKSIILKLNFFRLCFII
jgi:hypothetical protein